MPYPYPYKFSDWAGYNRACPDESGVASMNVNGNFLNRTGWSDGVVGSSTGTSVAKSLIGGAQTSGSAVITGIYGLTTGNGFLKFALNNGDNGTTNIPDSWNKLTLSWSGGSAVYMRSNASVSKQFGQYVASDWVWTWYDSGSSTTVPWSPNTASVTWVISQSSN